jgi:hypothetical protein
VSVGGDHPRPRPRVTTAAHHATLSTLRGARSLDGMPARTGSSFNSRTAFDEVDEVLGKRMTVVKVVAGTFFWIAFAGLGLVAPGRCEAQEGQGRTLLGIAYGTGGAAPGGGACLSGSYAYRPPAVGVYVVGGRRAFRSPVVFTYSPPHYYGHHFALEAMPSVPLIYPGYVAYPTPIYGFAPAYGGASAADARSSRGSSLGSEADGHGRGERSPPAKGRAPTSRVPEIIPLPTPMEEPAPNSPSKRSPDGRK